MPESAKATSAADLIRPYAWEGFSGQPVTGAAAANHLTVTLRILDREGWVRNYREDDPETGALDGITVKSSFREMLYGLVSAVRDVVTGRGPVTLACALLQADGEGSDSDSRYAAEHCLQAILRARYGRSVHDPASYDSWADRQGRTFDEVRQLLTEAAELACTHGPVGE